MARNSNRILVSHAGTLPRPADLQEMNRLGLRHSEAYQDRLPGAVKEVVRRQAEMGIDIVNDGELGKSSFTDYVRDRISGIAAISAPRQTFNIMARDAIEFPNFIAERFGENPQFRVRTAMACTGPLRYAGHAQIGADIARLKAGLNGLGVQGYVPAVAPGTIEHWLFNDHYKTTEEFLFAIADAMAEEYKAITDAGLILQIDDPDLPDGWQMFPGMSIRDYRKYAALRVDALNHALRKIPEEQIRLHVCWGSNHGPHQNDIELSEIVDIVLRTKAACYSVEAANPRHEHDWRVWTKTKLPNGKSLMPGVVGHATDIIEHPRLVADRLIQYANLVGRENVVAGTDCGIGSRVGHAEVAWAKLAALVAGAEIASRELRPRRAAKKARRGSSAGARKRPPAKRAVAKRPRGRATARPRRARRR